jgi:hypothetical protein
MSSPPLAFHAGDISALARSLRAQLADRPEPPGHLAFLNMLAKAVGCRNFQHFRAQAAARVRLEKAPPPPEPAVDPAKILKIARCFDAAGNFARWPKKYSEQQLCLWVMWSRIPVGRVMNEKQVNGALNENHNFGDHALLRRELCNMGILVRTPDGGEYRRVERRPPAEAIELIRHLRLRGRDPLPRTA